MIFYPPDNISFRDVEKDSVFLAGSIEMGKAKDWQTKSSDFLKSYFEVFNPRRKDWDSSWEQTFKNPNFYQQVCWELHALDTSDFILMYFDPDTTSPITLLELGIYASSQRIVVVCPDGYYKKGNVDIVCNKFNIPQFDKLQDAMEYLIKVSYV